jgi:nucleoside-diphosphate-sugar epimerase
VILVTGGTGFIGRHLVTQLLADGLPLRVLSRDAARVAFPRAVESVTGDLAAGTSLAGVLAGVERVVHLAGLSGAAATEAELRHVNVAGTAALARAAREAGIHQFVLVSSAGVYGDPRGQAPSREDDPPAPVTAYQRSKLVAEETLRRELTGSPVQFAVLRPSQVYGPGARSGCGLLLEVARRRVWLHGPVPATVHLAYVADVVAAIRAVLCSDDLSGEVFNVGGERALDYRDLIAAIGRRVGHTPLQLTAPRWTAALAGVAGRAWRAAGAAAPARLERLSGAGINWSVDTAKARAMLGYRPVPLEAGLDTTAAWLRREGLLG